MSTSPMATLRICAAMVVALGLASDASAQWRDYRGSGRTNVARYGSGFSVGIGIQSTAPPWHYQRDVPGMSRSMREQERFYYDLDRTHRYRTREERYGDDFRDRYSTGDPFYHSYHRPIHARPQEPVFPPSYPHYGRAGFSQEQPIANEPVAGLAYSRRDANKRSVVADADVADLLRAAANRLSDSLSRMRDGSIWLRQLQPHRIIATIDSADFPGVLTDLVDAYEAVANNPRLVLVAEAKGFCDTHRLLLHYVQLQSRYPDAAFDSATETVYTSPPMASPVPAPPQPRRPIHPRPAPPRLNPYADRASDFDPQQEDASTIDRSPQWSVPGQVDDIHIEELPETQILPAPVGEPDR
jgi:hypothetical protein